MVKEIYIKYAMLEILYFNYVEHRLTLDFLKLNSRGGRLREPYPGRCVLSISALLTLSPQTQPSTQHTLCVCEVKLCISIC